MVMVKAQGDGDEAVMVTRWKGDDGHKVERWLWSQR